MQSAILETYYLGKTCVWKQVDNRIINMIKIWNDSTLFWSYVQMKQNTSMKNIDKNA